MPANNYTQSNPFSVQAVQAGATYSVSEFPWVSVQVISQYTGTSPTITFQTSNDGINWASTPLAATSTVTAPPTTGTLSTGVFYGPVTGDYFRLNFTGAYSSGTATGIVAFQAVPRVLHGLGGQMPVSQSGVFNVGLAAAATGGYSFLNIPTAATNNAIKSGAGTLHSFTMNTQVASATATLYDSLTATGTKIATITLPASLVGDGPITVPYDIAFATGLTIVTTGTNFDCTVTYK